MMSSFSKIVHVLSVVGLVVLLLGSVSLYTLHEYLLFKARRLDGSGVYRGEGPGNDLQINLDLHKRVVDTDEAGTLRIRLRNLGNRPIENLSVQIKAVRLEVIPTERIVTLPAGGIVDFSCYFSSKDLGEFPLTVEAGGRHAEVGVSVRKLHIFSSKQLTILVFIAALVGLLERQGLIKWVSIIISKSLELFRKKPQAPTPSRTP
jgi:hypothetical protein